MNFEDNNDLDGVVEFVKEQTTSQIATETGTLLAETFLKLFQNRINEEEMEPLRGELVKWAKARDPQSITNLMTPETVKDFLKPSLEITVGQAIKMFQKCINKE